MYQFLGMDKPESINDHFFYTPNSLSLDKLREQAINASKEHNVAIHFHRYDDSCAGWTHEFYGHNSV